MPTTKLGLPTITGNMTVDVVRDLNALAQKVDAIAGAPSGLAQLGQTGKVLAEQIDVTGLTPVEDFNLHKSNKLNPHGVTKGQIGLANVDDVQQASKQEFNTHVAERASTSQVGHVQLSTSVSSTSSTTAPTSGALKSVNDALTTHKNDAVIHRKIYIQSTAPSNPEANTIWIEV